MEELKVGEYGRTNLGNIIIFAWLENMEGKKYEDKVILIKNNRIVNEFYYFEKNEYIVKHSKDITELIEKDDYVNGCRVYEVEEKGITVYQKVKNSSIDYNWITKDEIEIIWTKEQLKSIEYKVN